MARHDEPQSVVSARLSGLGGREELTASVHIRRHVRAKQPPPPGADLLQPVAFGHYSPGMIVTNDLAAGNSSSSTFDPVRITVPAGFDLDGIVHSLAKSPDLPPGLGAPISVFRMGEGPDQAGEKAPRGGTQAVVRAIDILYAVAERPMMLAELAKRIGVSPPTCYRIAKAMADRGLLATSGRNGFALGPKAEELGIAYAAQHGPATD